MYHEFKGDRTITIHRLHEQYGPVVRISPNEVSFNNQDALKEIYGIKSEYSKGDFYELFVYYNERNTFTSLGKSEVREYCPAAVKLSADSSIACHEETSRC